MCRILEQEHELRERSNQLRLCHELGLSVKTIQRWREPGGGEDGRHGPRTVPANKLSVEERQEILETVNSAEWRDLSPNQIVPRLADQEIYLASESTMYRLLREHKQLVHRERSRPAKSRRPNEQEATGPHQLWSWDITYLRGPVRGSFYYLYMIEDVWSRKIVGWQIHEKESPELAASLFKETCAYLKLDPDGLVLHSDNGGPMKGSTMLATLQKLGVVASFSRPHVSDDNPYSEALFRTLKYRGRNTLRRLSPRSSMLAPGPRLSSSGTTPRIGTVPYASSLQTSGMKDATRISWRSATACTNSRVRRPLSAGQARLETGRQ